MIQYYLDLEMQVKKIRDLNPNYAHIQKIYSTAFYIAISLRFPGKTYYLYIGRGNGHEGVWLGEKPPASALRRRDNFLEYFRKYLSSTSFISLDIDKYDRIVKISFQKFGEIQSLLLFWKGRKLYFVHHFQETLGAPFKVMMSWKAKAVYLEKDADLFSLFDDVGRSQDMSHDRKAQAFFEIDQLLQNELSIVEGGAVFKPDFLQRKKTNIEEDLRKAQQWHKLQALLDRQDKIDDVYELRVEDQKIKFEGDLNPFERRDLVFQKIKKLKRGEKILSERLQEVTSKLENQKEKNDLVSQIPMNKPVWGVEKTDLQKVQKAEDLHYKIFDFDNYSVGVGLNAQGNDQLRSKWATKEDLWLHLDGLKSSHAIIKLKNSPTVTPEALNTGATILAHFSHLNDDWIPLIYTQVKNLKGVSGVAGKVIYKKEKHLRCPKIKIDILE